MKRALVALLFLVVIGVAACLGMFAWKLHPWVNAGTALQLGKWQFGDYEFQVWQRKNKSALEPFADGLFVRRGTNEWQAFCFDIQDNYSPKVELREVNGKVEVIRDGENRGIFDMTTGSFRAGTNSAVFTPDELGKASEPPGDWWLR